ncbi:hypothetical protein N4G37_13530, partial [Enterococcus faecalis]|nr:hypothetical protein [Enterococcus faecalis]
PSEYNGFKICFGKSTLHGVEIQELFKICTALQSTKPASGKAAGKLSQYNIIPPYQADVKGRVKLDRKLKVVVDSGNGTASTVAPDLLRALG